MLGWQVFFRQAAKHALTAILTLIFALFSVSAVYSDNKQRVKIGVLANKGKDEAIRMWQATADYLNAEMPQYDVSIVPLGFEQIDPAVKYRQIDFLIANSSIYVEMEAKYNITRIATMKNIGLNGSYTQFGGVIFCRADRDDIKTLSDLKGKSFLAVDETSLGGWHAAWRELKDNGINPYRDFSSVSFTGNHETIVMSVKDGRADAGTVRTDTLERMALDKKIKIEDFRILNQQAYPDFKFLISTRLYPEWPIAQLKHTSEDLARNIGISLIMMPVLSKAAKDANISGWTMPLDYHVVHDVLKELQLPPYKDYGKVTLSKAARQYWYIPILAFTIILTMASVMLHILKLNRMMISSNLALNKARNELEFKVAERTAELQKINAKLESEIDIRIRSEQKLLVAEKESREQMLFLQTIIDSVSDQIMVISPDYRVRLYNKVAKEFGNEDTFCYNISHNQDSPCNEDGCPCPLKEVINKRSPVTTIHSHYNKINDSKSIVEIYASPVFGSTGDVEYVIEICRDITEKVKNEEQQKKDKERLFLKQKDESISTLAGGIAHDFNNILMGVLGNAELLRLRLPLSPEESRPLDNIISSVERMADLTRQLLAYAKEGKYQHTMLNMSDILRQSLNLCHKGAAMKTKIRVELKDDLWQIIGDRSQITQVMVNILNNAFETMENTGGTLTVSAENIKARPAWTCMHMHEHPAGDYVSITISDTGPGIPESISKQIFEPFFSTKFLGRGLGLPAALGIVINHKGCITFESELNSGTKFQILLPRAEEISYSEKQKEPILTKAKIKPSILVVEDEEQVAQLLNDALQTFGYKVHTFDSGEKAVEYFRNSSINIDAVILDLQMPGMSGKETFKLIKQINPEAKIIISTGYNSKTALEELSPYIPDGFIQKPYRITEMQKTIQALLNATP